MPLAGDTEPSGARSEAGTTPRSSNSKREPISNPGAILLAQGYASGKSAELAQMSARAADISSGCALHLNTRPFFQQSERRRVVEILMSLLGGHLINFLHRFESGQLDACFLGGIAREPDVFQHQLQWKVRREIALQDERRLVVHDTRSNHRGLNQWQ